MTGAATAFPRGAARDGRGTFQTAKGWDRSYPHGCGLN
jgi:hypothetical protein